MSIDKHIEEHIILGYPGVILRSSLRSFTPIASQTANGISQICGRGPVSQVPESENNIFVAVGAVGTILTSSKSGKKWTARTTNVTETFQNVAWNGKNYIGSACVAVGNAGSAGIGSPLLFTSSDGATWTTRDVSGTGLDGSNLYAVASDINVSAGTGGTHWVAIGNNGTAAKVARGNGLTTWTDKGNTGLPVLSGNTTGIIWSPTLVTGGNPAGSWIMTANDGVGRLYSAYDALGPNPALTWALLYTNPSGQGFNCCAQNASRIIFGANAGYLSYSDNGGATWTEIQTGIQCDFDWIDAGPNNCWLAGGGGSTTVGQILASFDNGITWGWVSDGGFGTGTGGGPVAFSGRTWDLTSPANSVVAVAAQGVNIAVTPGA